MSNQWVNFHSHSMSSLLDGMSKFDEYAGRAKELGQPGMCFTEHGNLHGLLLAYEAAQKAGLKYFPGLEAYQARKTRFDTDPEERASGGKNEWGQHGPHHLGIVAYNNVGYQNLLKLSSRAYLEGYYIKPRIDHELLAEHSEGIVILSGCLSGQIQQALMRNDYDFALKTAATFQDIVGKDNFFIEIQNHFIPEELANHGELVDIAKAIGAPIIATCDSHYTLKEHSVTHDYCLCVNTGSTIDTPDRFRFSGDHFYLKSYEEMAELFPREYLDNTMLIYNKHDFKLDFGKYHIPNFPVPTDESQDQYFVRSVMEGATKVIGPDWRNDKRTVDRIEYEIGVITEMGFPNYFLIVSDIMRWCHANKIMTGAGRGSAAGSIVSYCLEITQLNPLDYNLPFERFLIPGRTSLPDVDLDIDDRYRERVIEYTRQKYGYDYTAQICNFSEIGAKSAVKDMARVMNLGFELGAKINDAMPPSIFGKAPPLEKCLESSEFRAIYENDPDAKAIIDAAKPYEGLWRQTGVHAAGLIVSDKPITDYVPLFKSTKKEYGIVTERILTQWDMFMVDKMGMLKIDFLGLRNLSIVDMAFDLVEKRHGFHVDNKYSLIKEQDPETYKALGRGENNLVFQLESAGVRELMVEMKPENITEIAALISLFRPGPMGSNFHKEYVARKHGRSAVEYLHPALEPYLGQTYGLLVYQEQVLSIARFVAGFSVPDSDGLRKAMGKKIPEEMKKWRVSFVKGCIEVSGFKEHQAQELFDEIQHHADYSFSLNHAMSYAHLSYLTSYLRTHYLIETLTAGLSLVGNSQAGQARLRLYLNECKKTNVKVVPPSLNYSGTDFKIQDEQTIIFGFNAVKGVGEILSNLLGNEDRHFDNLFDMMRKANPNLFNRDTVNHFLSAGCFDEMLFNMEISQPELTRQQRLQMLYEELDELGIFLTDHPFNDVQELISGKTTHTIGSLSDALSGEKVKVAGVILDIKKKMSKAGKRMYDMTIDDLDGSLAVKLMPKIAADLPDPPFEKGDIVIVFGRTNRYGDDENAALELMALQIDKIDDSYLAGGKPIILKTNKQLSVEQLNKINDIIESTPGNSPVFLEYNNGFNEVKLKFHSPTSREKEPTLNLLLGVLQ